MDLPRGGRPIELVLAGLESAAEGVVHEQEGARAADDAGGLQFGGNATAGGARAQEDELRSAGLDGQVERPGQPDGDGEDENQENCENRAHFDSKFR